MFWLQPPQKFAEILLKTPKGTEKVVLHLPTHKIIKKRIIRIPAQNYQQYYAISKWRMDQNSMKNESSIINILHGKLLRENDDGRSSVVCAYVEGCDHLLHQIQEMRLKFALSMLKQVISGLKRLILKFGYFGLTDKMIGSVRNKWKMWINECFQQNRIQFAINQKGNASMKRVIAQLLALTQKHTENTQQTKLFFSQATCCENLIDLEKMIQKSESLQFGPATSRIYHASSGIYSQKKEERQRRPGTVLPSNQFNPQGINFIYAGNQIKEKPKMKISFNYISPTTARHRDSNFKLDSKVSNQNIIPQFKNCLPLKISQDTLADSNDKVEYFCKVQQRHIESPEKPNLKKKDNLCILNKGTPKAFIKLQHAKNVQSPQQQEGYSHCKSSNEKTQQTQRVDLMQRHMKRNEWTQNIQLFQNEIHTQQSINLGGEQINHYLQDVKLQQLDKLGKLLAVSMFQIEDEYSST